MCKIVINNQYGGFGLSDDAFERYLKLKGINYVTTESTNAFSKNTKNFWKDGNIGDNSSYLHCRDIDRNDPALIQVIEEMGDKANDRFASLKVVEIPDDVDWQIEEYDGNEWVAEKHRTWS